MTTRVLIVTTNYPRWESDPHSPWLVELLGYVRQHDVQVEVHVPAYAGSQDHVIDGVQVHRFRYAPAPWETLTHEDGAPAKIARNPLYLFLLPIYLLAGSWTVWRLARKGNFDIIHVQWPMPQGLFGLVAQWAGGGRLVATFHGSELQLTRRFAWTKPMLGYFVQRCAAISVNSSYTAGILTSLFGVTPAIIPFGASPVQMAGARPVLTEPGLILTVARLIERKGIDYLLQALALIADLPEAHLVVVGEGIEHANLERLAQDLGLADRVQFTGRLSREPVHEWYQRCQVFVLPSTLDRTGDTETLGVVSLEAMLYAKPVIASRVGGIPDVVRHAETGLLVPEKDAQALAQALRTLLTDPALAQQYGRAGQERLQSHFSWDAIVAKTLTLYDIPHPQPNGTKG